MLKRLSKIILCLTMVIGLAFGQSGTVSAAGQDDINVIKERLKEYFLGLGTIDDGSKVETCYVSKASDYLALIKEDGSFADVDYNAHNNAANGSAWSPYLAIDRLQAIAIAYHKEGNALYKSVAAKDGLDKALKNWTTQGNRDEDPNGKGKPRGPWSENWWENEVGVQLRFARIGLFMEGVISTEGFKVITDKLIEKTPVEEGTGQNNLWFDQNHVYHALLTNNSERLKEMVNNYLNYCLSTQLDDKTDEAVQVDNSFYMHGRQFYSNGYGMSMFRDMSFWIYMLRETEFKISQEVVDRMADYMLAGTSWTIRGDIMELYLGYRPYKFDVGYTNYAKEYIEPLKRMIVADPDRASRYQAVLDNIDGKKTSNSKNGNNYMWRSGYASHMRDNYGVNIKMDSKDIIGGEWRGSWPAGQNQGQLIYWTSSSTSTITVDGDEYTNVFPTYDWAHCPGSTTANRIVKDYANYGRFTNGTEHTIGVSNGKYGTTAYVMDKKNTQATKGYFFFDDEFVALGAGINSKEEVNIHTTLNQSESDNVVVGGQAVAEGTKAKEYTTNWLYNDKVGYVMPKESKVFVSNTKQADLPSLWAEKQKSETPATFSAWMDHGLNPTNGSYEYIVVPGKTASEVEQYSSNIPVTIVSNTKDVQAVRHDGLKQTQINFYKAGTLEYAKGKTITVDQPCNIIIDESKSTPVISLAVADTDSGKEVKVKLNIGGTQSETQFVVGQAPYAGQTMTLEAGQTNAYTASSYSDGHLPAHAYDNDSNTYWKSETGESQWILQALGKRTFISTMNIDWKDNYAKKYKVQISTDGINYTDIAAITNGDGGKDEVSIFSIATHVKIVCEASNKSVGYEIAEITYKGGTNIALDKKVQASSTSTNDPGNIARNAVDGNTATRWSSKRDSHDEWISVDLGGKANIDAVRILWEGARSLEYIVEISDDNVTWKALKTVKESSVLLDEILLDKTETGRYIRIHSVKSKVTDKNYGISIYELEVYGDVELAPEEELENIAVNKSASASSINSTDAPERAIDGNISSFWKSDLKKEHYLNVFLKDRYTVSKVAINWGNQYLDSHKIEVSQDNVTWETVEIISNCSGGKEVINFNESIDARYVRIIGSTSTDKNVVINEFEIFGVLKETVSGVNLALNKPSSASSEYKDGSKIYYPSLAFDGNTTSVNGQQSRWVSNRDYSHDEWIQVDLEEEYAIDSIVLNWEGTSTHEYKILVSSDRKNWNEVKYVNSGSGIKEILFAEPVVGRYVKVQGVKVGAKYGYSLWEFEVYGKKEVFANVALNKEGKASSEYKDGSKIYYPSLAFDGSAASINGKQSRWVSNRKTNNEWIYVNLNGKYDIRSIILNWEGVGGKDYVVQVSDDAYTWEDIFSETEGKGGVKEIVLDKPVYAQYVRMHGNIPGGIYGFSLWEFEVYGKKMGDFFVDKTVLQALVTGNTGIIGDGYTPDSYKVFSDAFKAAREALENINAKQEEINTCIENLKTVVSQLEKHDTEKLRMVISLSKSKMEEYYTEASYKTMKDILKEAETLLKNGANNNTEYETLATKLDNAVKGLVTKDIIPEVTVKDIAKRIVNLQIVDNALILPRYEGFEVTMHSSSNESIVSLDGQIHPDKITQDINIVLQVIKIGQQDTALTNYITVKVQGTEINYEGLKTVIVLVESKDEVDYTKASYQAMMTIYKKAKSLIENGAKNDQEVENLRVELVKEIQELVSLVNIKELLTNASNIKADDYTPKTIEALNKAINNAKAIIEKEDASKLEVEDAINLLNITLNGLVKKANKGDLFDQLNQAKNLDESKYTVDSFEKLLVIKEKAQLVYDNQNVTNAEVVQVYNELKTAIDSLIVKPGEYITPDGPIVNNKVVSTPSNDVIITGNLPKDIELLTKTYSQKEITRLIDKINKANPEFLKSTSLEKVLDIELMLKGKEYNFDGTINVILKLDKELKDKNIGIVYIDEQGNIVKVKSLRDKEYISFDVSHLSTYAIVSYNEKNDEGISTPGNVIVPKTSDSTNIMMYGVMITIVATAFILLKKRKED